MIFFFNLGLYFFLYLFFMILMKISICWNFFSFNILNSLFLLFMYINMLMCFNNKMMFEVQELYHLFSNKYLNLYFMFGFDNINLMFVLLSIMLIMFCLLLFWNLNFRLYFFMMMLIFSLICLMCMFLSFDMIVIFFFFESMIMPKFLLICIWGSSESKIYAAYLFFFFTLFNSIFILVGFLNIFFLFGSSNLFYFKYTLSYFLSFMFMFLFLFFGFSIKVPMMPIHIWLPEAHVEAPTMGSMLLAGLLLKLGAYIYLSMLIVNFFSIILYFYIMLWTLFLLGVIFAILTCLNQLDLKKMVAYSSMSHMNFSLMGLFSGKMMGVLGSVLFLVGHAFVSSLFFFMVGILYDSYKTSYIYYFGGLTTYMPLMSFFFFFCMLSDFSFPGTVNFVSEILIFMMCFYYNNFIFIILSLTIMLGVVYSSFFFTSIFFGPLKVQFMSYYCDINSMEFYSCLPYMFLIIIFGLVPNFFLNFMNLNIYFLSF